MNRMCVCRTDLPTLYRGQWYVRLFTSPLRREDGTFNFSRRGWGSNSETVQSSWGYNRDIYSVSTCRAAHIWLCRKRLQYLLKAAWVFYPSRYSHTPVLKKGRQFIEYWHERRWRKQCLVYFYVDGFNVHTSRGLTSRRHSQMPYETTHNKL